MAEKSGTGGGPRGAQALLKGGLVQGLDGNPVQAGLCGGHHVPGEALGDPEGQGALALGVAQTKGVIKNGFDHVRVLSRGGGMQAP